MSDPLNGLTRLELETLDAALRDIGGNRRVIQADSEHYEALKDLRARVVAAMRSGAPPTDDGEAIQAKIDAEALEEEGFTNAYLEANHGVLRGSVEALASARGFTDEQLQRAIEEAWGHYQHPDDDEPEEAEVEAMQVAFLHGLAVLFAPPEEKA